MLLGSARASQYGANPVPDYSATYGTYQGFFASPSNTAVAAYNTARNIITSVTHSCGTVNHIRSKRIPGTSSQIVGISGSTATKFYRYTPGTGFVLLATSTGISRTSDIAFDTTNGFIYMVATVSTSPYIRIYQATLSDTVATATLQSNPAVLPGGVTQHVCFSPDGTKLAVNHATSPFMKFYNRSGSTFTSVTITAGTVAPLTQPRSFEISFTAYSSVMAWRTSTSQVRLVLINNQSTMSTATLSVNGIGFNPNTAFSDVFISNDINNSDGYRLGFLSGNSLSTGTINLGITGRQPYWSPDGMKVAIQTGTSTIDLYDFNPYYTQGSTQVGQILNTQVKDFAVGASGFDWMYY